MADDTEALLVSWNLALHDKAPSTRRLYSDTLRRFARELPGGKSLLDVTRRDTQAYLARLQADGLARATIRSRWIALRSFYAWALAEDELDTNPMADVKVAKADSPPPQFPDDDDVYLVLKTMGGRGIWDRRDLAMVRVAAATGMRLHELCNLRIDDVDLVRCVAHIRHGKGDKSRLVRFDSATGAAIDRYLRTRARHRLHGLPELWITRFGPFHRPGAMHMLRRRCEQAGVEPFGWHALRHRFAHAFLERGGNEGSLARLGGWSDPAVMARYGASRATQRAFDEYEQIGGVL